MHQPEENLACPRPSKGFLVSILILFLMVGTLWAFPQYWYGRGASSKGTWFSENSQIAGWTWSQTPVAESAERILTADQLVNGEFTDARGRVVRVFSAKRFSEKSNDVGLFVHTPDRCWTEAGWSIQLLEPAVTNIVLHGLTIPFERRLFMHGSHRELVYFAGLVGGEPLPYRMDHNLRIGVSLASTNRADRTGTLLRATDSLYWQRLLESFRSRRALLGPKQFFRISAPAAFHDLSETDVLLQDFLGKWLQPGNAK